MIISLYKDSPVGNMVYSIKKISVQMIHNPGQKAFLVRIHIFEFRFPSGVESVKEEGLNGTAEIKSQITGLFPQFHQLSPSFPAAQGGQPETSLCFQKSIR
jgi:hypothetical protein